MRELPAIQHTEQLYYENILRYDTVHLKRYKLALNYMDEKSRVLDYGCGAGYGSFLMSGEAGEVFSVDADKTAIAYAKEFYYRKNITHLNLDHPPSDWLFDTIVCFECIEHVEDAEVLMRTFHELLNPGGVIVLSVPNEGVVPHAESGNHFHKRHYTPKDFDELITTNGFKIDGLFTQLTKGFPDIVPGSFGFTLIAVAKKI